MSKAEALGPVGGGIKPLRPEDVTHIVIHCSATGPNVDIGAADIERWHRNKGYRTIGYHHVIRRDGRLEKGRELTQRGAHVEGYNHCSVGICLVGGTDGSKLNKPQANFTAAQLKTLEALVHGMLYRFPNASVVGHRDIPGVNKACPAFSVALWLSTGQLRP